MNKAQPRGAISSEEDPPLKLQDANIRIDLYPLNLSASKSQATECHFPVLEKTDLW